MFCHVCVSAVRPARARPPSRNLALCATPLSPPMLRVRMLSGNELVSLPLEELSDVKELKSRLSRIPGLPSRFRQRLSRCGSLLDDSAILDSPLDLELVLLPHSAASQTQADELVDASANGFASEACHFCRNIYPA